MRTLPAGAPQSGAHLDRARDDCIGGGRFLPSSSVRPLSWILPSGIVGIGQSGRNTGDARRATPGWSGRRTHDRHDFAYNPSVSAFWRRGPVAVDVPIWVEQVRRIADHGYSTVLIPDFPQLQPSPAPPGRSPWRRRLPTCGLVRGSTPLRYVRPGSPRGRRAR